MSSSTCELSLKILHDLRDSVASVALLDLSDSQKDKFAEILHTIDTLIQQQRPLKCNCNVCAHPWRKDKGEVFCYVRDDEYHEHALVIENPELNTCSNFRSSKKNAGFCKYEWGCAFRRATPDGYKCTNNVYCPKQTRRPEKN